MTSQDDFQDRAKSESQSDIDRKTIKPHSEPIFQTSVYDYPDLESIDAYYEGRSPLPYIYGRYGLPNTVGLGSLISGAEHCEAGLVCSSGMGAIFVALLTASKRGGSVLCSKEIYGETYSLLRDLFPDLGRRIFFAETGDVASFEIKVNETQPDVIFLETISNPKLRVCDLKRISMAAHKTESIVIVDNTMASPYVVIPSDLGADVTIHSGTKFLGGHHDLTIGVVSGKSEFIGKATDLSRLIGTTAAPFDSWLARRSYSTWEIRVVRSSENAMKLATFLQNQTSAVSRVYYPGLTTHPDHELAKRYFKNGLFGGVVTFDMDGGASEVNRFISSLSSITLTPSFGGVSTTISHPGKTSHRMLSVDEKKSAGITDNMIRVSVGIEDYASIESEFKKAFDKL